MFSPVFIPLDEIMPKTSTYYELIDKQPVDAPETRKSPMFFIENSTDFLLDQGDNESTNGTSSHDRDSDSSSDSEHDDGLTPADLLREEYLLEFRDQAKLEGKRRRYKDKWVAIGFAIQFGKRM